MICRNNENYFEYIFPVLLQNIKLFEPKFYIYENNSTDNTKNILQTLKKNNNIKIFSEDINNYSNNRYFNICNARNKLLLYYKKYRDKDNNNKWVFLLDTNIIFNSDNVIKLINNKTEGKMILANTCFYDINDDLNDKYYYDTLALNYGEYFLKNKITFDLWKDNEINLKSGFGGLVLIDKNYLLLNKWYLKIPEFIDNKKFKNIICEHWYYCYKLNKEYPNSIYLIKDCKCLWYLDKYINYKNKNKFYKYINNKYK